MAAGSRVTISYVAASLVSPVPTVARAAAVQAMTGGAEYVAVQ